MGNSNNKLPLRKSLSLPDTQFLSADGDFMRSKSRSSQRLFKLGSSHDIRKAKFREAPKVSTTQRRIPLVEALFLPEFPLQGDLDELGYEVVGVIAKGAFGNVLKVRREDEKAIYAMKIMNKTSIIIEGAVQQCKDEAAIQSMLGDHPFLVKTQEYWQSKKQLYIVLDYKPYGDVFTLWRYHERFPPVFVKYLVAEMAMVLDYLHKAGVIYRDIKMENILFNEDGHVQVTDFGLAKWLMVGEKTRTVCGTLQYMAPEVLAVYPYGHAADWWSLGILMFVMLAGKYPVDGAENHKLMASKVFEWEFKVPYHLNYQAQEAISRLLTKSPLQRLTDVYELQHLSFFKELNFTDLIERKVCPKDVVPEDFFSLAMTQALENGSCSGTADTDDFEGFEWNLPEDVEPVFV
ncbi:ribosomal protein S6 kinase-related protein-like [Liolophura sinensis]|uniref:ribosomal protein S6 kinase-related protein-like n=1 Tax=Liolophura sinensis TaxID=3198878 RepID=UPI0031581C54